MLLELFLFYVVLDTALATDYEIRLKNDGPVVKGGTINFYANVYYKDQIDNNEYFQYLWEDNAIPQHKNDSTHPNASDKWTVTYATTYPAGVYEAQVTVKKCILHLICYEIGSSRINFHITETLNGHMNLIQNNITRPNVYVSNTDLVVHSIELKKSDLNYILKAPLVVTYWFVDCTYYGITTDFKFKFNYSEPNKVHNIEALVMADFTPLPPTTTVAPSSSTTTTIKPINITTTNPSTTTASSTSVKPVPSGGTTVKPSAPTRLTIKKRDVSEKPKHALVHVDTLGKNTSISALNGTAVPVNLPFICNASEVIGGTTTYGYFSKRVEVRAPLSKVNVSGNNWLQPGDLLSLKVTCKGSKNIEYCVEYRKGEYNITGNETCFVYEPLDSCSFSIKRYLSHPKNTILIILKNEVSKVVTPVTVNIYKVNKQPQLSVIVVPVSFSLVAVVLIVFGIAYYFQNRSRFLVEVADFNFGQQYTDMEYKTFSERLKDSIMNAFTRGPTPSSSEVPVWPPGRKYGSMT